MIYQNPLRSAEDIAGFRLEGDGAVSFPHDRLRLESRRPPEDGQDANVVLWCPADFGPDITVEWDFWPIREMRLTVRGGVISFEVAGLPCLRWQDPEPLAGGRIGFRQMAPMIGEYANLRVNAA